MNTNRLRRQTELSRLIRMSRRPPVRQAAMISRGLGPMVAHTVSSAFLVPPKELGATTRRNAQTAHARQVAMYLAHVGFGLSYVEAGLMFGRDRTTVAHACRRVEYRREDARFDASLDCLEHTLRARVHGVYGAPAA
jgi:Bacterial dnaA protein helix-turn-helix